MIEDETVGWHHPRPAQGTNQTKTLEKISQQGPGYVSINSKLTLGPGGVQGGPAKEGGSYSGLGKQSKI